MKDLRIAAVVHQSYVGQIRSNFNQMVGWARLAEKEGAKLVCFPELNLCGYGTRSKLPLPVLSLNDPIISEIVALSVSLDVVILAGLIECGRHNENYISHIVVTPNGNFGVYRKLHMAPPEQALFSCGDKVPVFKAAGTTFGIQLCYDAHFPELSAKMTELGAEVIFIPHASPKGSAVEKHNSWMRHLPARAFDNSIFIVACNQVGGNSNQLTFPGNALVLGPSGKLITKTTSGREGLLLADLEADVLNQVRNHPMRYFFPNRRTDIYH
jgi:predicted amidohydrolase